MKYFVSIENIDYFRWQVELLIESFKVWGSQNDLIISIAQNESLDTGRFLHNLRNHKNIYAHENIGKKEDCPQLNKLYGLLYAHERGLLGKQYFVIHPDMLLLKKVVSVNVPNDNLVYHPDLDPIGFDLSISTKSLDTNFLTLGDTMLFNNMPASFIRSAYTMMGELRKNSGSSDWDIERAAWALAMSTHNGVIKTSIRVFETPLTNTNDAAAFIHYKHGMPGLFCKSQFKNHPDSLIMAPSNDPLKLIGANNPNKSTEFMNKIILSYHTFVKTQNMV
jgi:hypothetical protein